MGKRKRNIGGNIMAVKKIAKATDLILNVSEFIGVSTDVATLPVSIVGSTFYAVDTKEAYITDGVAWFLI